MGDSVGPNGTRYVMGHTFCPMDECDRDAFAGADEGTLICQHLEAPHSLTLLLTPRGTIVAVTDDGSEVEWGGGAMLRVTLEVSAQQVADLFTTAIESGDPVTTASRGGWCEGINSADSAHSLPEGEGPWYARPAFWAGDFHVTVVEYDEDTGATTDHKLDTARVEAGLLVLVQKFPSQLAAILGGDADAGTADIFLQCCCFGEEKYA